MAVAVAVAVTVVVAIAVMTAAVVKADVVALWWVGAVARMVAMVTTMKTNATVAAAAA